MKQKSKKPSFNSATAVWSLQDAYRGPGHLIRRLQQIAVAIFMDEFKILRWLRSGTILG
jgi:hypothetical protein